MKEFVQSSSSKRRNEYAIGKMQPQNVQRRLARDAVNFIQHRNHFFGVNAEFFQNFNRRSAKVIDLRMARIQDVHQKISQNRLFESRFESLNEVMRQISHKTNGVSQQQPLPRRKFHTPRCRIKSRKKLVLDKHACTGEL